MQSHHTKERVHNFIRHTVFYIYVDCSILSCHSETKWQQFQCESARRAAVSLWRLKTPDYMQKYVNVFVQTQGGRIHRALLNGSEALTSLFHETLTVIILFTQQLNCIPVKYRCVYCVRIRTMNKCLRVSPYSPHHVFLNPPCPVYTSSVSVLTRPLTFVQSSSLFSAFNLSINITE